MKNAVWLSLHVPVRKTITPWLCLEELFQPLRRFSHCSHTFLSLKLLGPFETFELLAFRNLVLEDDQTHLHTTWFYLGFLSSRILFVDMWHVDPTYFIPSVSIIL